MAGARYMQGDRCVLDFGTADACDVKVTKALRSGYVYVQNVHTWTTYKVHSSRLHYVGK